MIADIFKQGFGSLYRQISKRCSYDNLLDNHNMIQFQTWDPVIVNVLAYPLDRNGSRPIRAARATTSPHIQKWLSEAVLFIKSSLVANKTFCQSE